MIRRSFLSLAGAAPALLAASRAHATGDAPSFAFDSIDGGAYDTGAWRGNPVLVVNTASLCGFTPQYDSLQALHTTYADRGLVVLAVPSDDFAQELNSNEDVAAFCEVNFNLTLPMTTITSVRGRNPHPFYAWMRREHGFRPVWNFNKVLLDAEGQPVATFGSNADPMGPRMRRAIDALLAG